MRGAFTLGVVLTLLTAGRAAAEGSAQTGTTQELYSSTDLYVDIIDQSIEWISWSGACSIDLYDPADTFVTTLYNGGSYQPLMAGAYFIDLSCAEDNWDVAVTNAAPDFGRLWSYYWYFNAHTYAQANALEGSFYAMVTTGSSEYDQTVQLAPDGFAGYVYSIAVNSTGIDDENGRSVPENGQTYDEDYRVYLNPPEVGHYATLTPVISNDLFAVGPHQCNQVHPGITQGDFRFDSNVDGTYHVVCDLDEDGTLDFTSMDDMHLIGEAWQGANTVVWDGYDNDGAEVPVGTYSCQIILTVGEFHYVGYDIETSYQGFRLFQVDTQLNRTGLPMYWNDGQVQYAAVTMPDGQTAVQSSGPFGIDSGSYTDTAAANVNARAWGNFNATSKGNESLLDTYTWIDDDRGSVFTVEIIDITTDTDGDDLSDFAETCDYGTDPNDPDTDGDGLDDGLEVYTIGTDPLDADSDGDGVDDLTEVVEPSGPADTDGDGMFDAQDTDDDGDTVLTIDEDVDGDGDPTNDDSDGDGDPDYLDADDDDDGVPTLAEDWDGNGDPLDDDVDADGIPNFLDGDDDGDGLWTEDEDLDGDGDPANDDTDGDGTPDYLDADDDGDGSMTLVDNCPYTVNPSQDDNDGDGLGNECDDCTDIDGDGFGDAAYPFAGCSEPSDGDCDDTDAAQSPVADELCNGEDDDCDGVVDEDDALDVTTWYADVDGDGYGYTLQSLQDCYQPYGYVADATDCDDTDAGQYPGATEMCNGEDDDCDGVVDEGDALDVATWYADGDGDGFGDASVTQVQCAAPIGYVLNDTDCDDSDMGIYPGAAEAVCDGLDNDCDPYTLDEPDGDVDGYTVCDDCDDGVPAINPGMLETWCDGLDNDCDPSTTDEPDFDGDGHTLCTDCDDTNAAMFPTALEICDGYDNDCDPTTDETGDVDGDGYDICMGDCDDFEAAMYPGAEEVCDGLDNDCDAATDELIDGDGDAYTICHNDCDDTNIDVYPNAAELCDTLDNDCDGVVPSDEVDLDGDGALLCEPDCDDADVTSYPGAPELCDQVDNDCDGDVDEDVDEDVDGDNYNACQGDCDNGDASVNPSMEEICDGVDTDCDGFLPADEYDEDGDGWSVCEGDCDDTDPSLNRDDADSDGFETCEGDCNDSSGWAHPGAEEICDGLDNDCNGYIDEVDLDGDGYATPECGGEDCDDEDRTVHPGVSEQCGDETDNDCDGLIDMEDDECVDPEPVEYDQGCECDSSGDDALDGPGLLAVLVLLALFIRNRVS